jgi:hypothetical protein
MLTDWFLPPAKPKRIGWYDAHFFDCGWPYEWRVWFDGMVWRDRDGGLTLIDQNLTWRGQTEQTK